MSIRSITHHVALILFFLGGCQSDAKFNDPDSATIDPGDGPVDTDDTDDTDPPADDSGEPPPDPDEICNGEDDDGDGLVDEGMWTRTWSNDDGALVWVTGSGVSTQTTTFDEWSDGTTDWEEVTSLDTSDRVTIISHAGDEDTSTTTYTWSSDDELTAIETVNDDGVLHTATYYSYSGGHMVGAEYYETNWEGAYGLIRTQSWTWDADGNLTESQEDANGDGTVDTIVSYTYSDGGRVVTESHYVTRLSAVFTIVVKTYSDTGKLLKEETDTDASGSIDTTNSYTYDDDDRLIQKDQDYDGDGEANSRTTYAYDSEGRRTVTSTDQDADGLAERRTTTVWTADGLFEIHQDDDGDGDADPWVEFRYSVDDVGNFTMEIEDPDDATDDGTHTTTYRFACRN